MNTPPQTGNRLAAWLGRPWAPAAVVFVVALILRVIHHAYMQSNDPFYGVLWPGGDNFVWDRWASEIAQAQWLSPERTPFWQGPLYPYGLGMVYLRFGHSYTAAVVAQHLLGAITAALVTDTARHIFSRRAALLAGLGAAACPLFLLFEGEILSDSFILFWNAALIWAVVRASDRDRVRDWCLAGVLLGLACLARPNAILMLPVLAVWCAWVAPSRRLPKAAALVVCAAACIAPATLANTLVGGKFALITVNGPMNLYIGNSHDARGDYSRSESFREIAAASDLHEHDIDWTAHLRASIREHPLSLPRNMAWKARLYWQRMEIPHNVSFAIKREFSPLLQLPLTWAWIAPLGVVGIALAFWPRVRGMSEKRRMLLVGYLLLYTASIILVFVLARFRMPALAILLIFAAHAIDRMMEWLIAWRTGRQRAAYPLLAALVAYGALAASMAPPSSMEAIRWNDYYNLGGAYEEKGRYAEAAAAYDAALELVPDAPAIVLARERVLALLAQGASPSPTN